MAWPGKEEEREVEGRRQDGGRDARQKGEGRRKRKNRRWAVAGRAGGKEIDGRLWVGGEG